MEKCIICLGVRRAAHRDLLFLATGQLRLERCRDLLSEIGLDLEDIDQFAVVGLGPQMRVIQRIDQLHADPYLLIRFLDASFENVRDAQLLRDFLEIRRRALVTLRRGPRNDLQVRDLRQPGEDFFLDTIGEIGVRLVFAQVFERQDRDRFQRYFR